MNKNADELRHELTVTEQTIQDILHNPNWGEDNEVGDALDLEYDDFRERLNDLIFPLYELERGGTWEAAWPSPEKNIREAERHRQYLQIKAWKEFGIGVGMVRWKDTEDYILSFYDPDLISTPVRMAEAIRTFLRLLKPHPCGTVWFRVHASGGARQLRVSPDEKVVQLIDFVVSAGANSIFYIRPFDTLRASIKYIEEELWTNTSETTNVRTNK